MLSQQVKTIRVNELLRRLSSSNFNQNALPNILYGNIMIAINRKREIELRLR